jgi:hypothetical protein
MRSGKLRYLLAALSTVPRGRTRDRDRTRPSSSSNCPADDDRGGRRRGAGAVPLGADRVLRVAPLAQEWTYRFLGGGLAHLEQHAAVPDLEASLELAPLADD